MAFLLGEAVAGALEVDCQAGEPHAEGGGSVVNSLADVVIDTVSVALAWPVIWAPVPAGIIPMALWARARAASTSNQL